MLPIRGFLLQAEWMRANRLCGQHKLQQQWALLTVFKDTVDVAPCGQFTLSPQPSPTSFDKGGKDPVYSASTLKWVKGHVVNVFHFAGHHL